MFLHLYLTNVQLFRPKQVAATMNMPVAEDKLSLSIIFRISSAATDRIVQEEDLEVNSDSTNQMASLDLVIPSHNDFEIFVSTLKNLMILNKKYFTSMHRDILLLQHHWMEIGKQFDATVNQSEWTIICCDRLSVDIGRNAILSLFRKYCQAMKTDPDEGISISKAVGLLEHIRKISLTLKAIPDPCEVVWNRIESSGKGSKPLGKQNVLPNNDDRNMLVFSDDNSIGGDSTIAVQKAKVRSQGKKSKVSEEYVSVQAFLNFMHNEQKDTNMTLNDARSIFARLNAQTYASQLSTDGITRDYASVPEQFSKDFISKTVFFNYLRSDANDAFNPEFGESEHDDMSLPLSSYWINSSHNTYLKNTAPRRKQHIGENTAPFDISMYTNALNRGTRCLEVDVWEGAGNQTGKAVVRFDEEKSVGKGNANKEGILFSDIVKVLHSFLVSEPSSLPIILFIESHCSIQVQESMVHNIHSILGTDDMIYVPSDEDIFDDTKLPSPNDLRGKVVLKFKMPSSGKDKVIYDDRDDFNDIDPFGEDAEIEKDMVLLPGVDALGSILFESSRELEKKNPNELVADASKKAKAARKAAEVAEDKAFNANVKVNRASDLANKLMKKAGLTPEKIERRLGKGSPVVEETKRASSVAEDSTTNEKENDTSVPTNEVKNAQIPHNATDDDATADDGTLYTTDSTVISKRKQGNFFSRVLGWVGTLDGSVSSDEDTYLRDDREAAQSMDEISDSDDDDSRDDIDFDIDESVLKEFDVDVNTFNELPTNVLEDLIERKIEKERAARLKAEGEDRFHKFQMHKGSISNVEKKLENMQENVDVDSGVEVEHFYGSSIDDTLLVHREAERDEEKASKLLGTATAAFNKRQQEYELAKKNLEMVERLKSYEEQLEAYMAKKKQAETATSTSKSEFQVSEERALETAENAKKAHEERKDAHQKEKDLVEKRRAIEDALDPAQEILDEKTTKYEEKKKRYTLVKHEHEKVTENIKKIEGSHRFKVERREASRGALSEDTATRKHRMEIEKQLKLNAKIQQTKKSRSEAEQERIEAEKVVRDLQEQLDECDDAIAKTKDFADKYDSYVEQMDQVAEEEKDAAKLREEAAHRAENVLQSINAHIHKLKTKISDINLVKEDGMSSRNVAVYGRACEKAKEKLDNAEIEFKEAQESYKWADAKLKDANELLNENSEVLKKAKANAVQLEHRVNAHEALKQNAINSYERLKTLQKEADDARVEASRLRVEAAEKENAVRRANDYKQRLSMVSEISPALSKLSLLYSSKLRYFEESMTLPAHNMHSIAEGKILQLLTNDPDEVSFQMRAFNKTHLSRTFPSRHKKLRGHTSNFNPVLPWSLGCQMVSMNQQICDAFVLVNDARFRTNGSCGYVLKPATLLERVPRRHQARIIPSKWQIKILSAYNLPKTRRKALAGPINPRIRVTLYDGGCGDPVVHLSSSLERNGLNPVWNEKRGAVFDNIKNSDCAVILFSVWDYNEGGVEEFIAAAGIPLSCMREGYRSVPLFDSNHMKCGAHAFTSLFVHVSSD